MSEVDELIADLERGHAGTPWHGPSRAVVLADVSAEEAAWAPPGSVHSIWEIVLHMTAWTNEVARRLLGGVPDYPAAGDWPPVPTLATEAEWAHAMAALNDAHQDLIATLRGIKSVSLAELIGNISDGQLGTRVSHAAMVRGIAQHDAYHTGQIAILKKLFRNRLN
ncbi:MAG TPA: DinB family protein [Gemmatimonadaceae bacterium]|nr:DinB family protein [Gemmatimonadaceae bacterium]